MARLRIITARRPGICGKCRQRFARGTQIEWAPGETYHTEARCPARAGDHYGSPSEAASGVAEPVSHVFETSGGTFYRNRNGTCEDAPCCGCCTV